MYLPLQDVIDTLQGNVRGPGGTRSAQQRSPASKLARLARMAEAKLGRPNNKKRWGTLVEAAKTAKVTKMLSKSRSDESLSSGNECEQEQEPLQYDDRSPDDAITQEGQEMENRITVSSILRYNSGGGGLSLDPAALAARHLTEKFRTKRPPKTSVSFDENTTANSNENRDSSTDLLVQGSENSVATAAAASPSCESRSMSPSLVVSESCEPLMMEHNRAHLSQQSSVKPPLQLSPSSSEPPTFIPSIGQPANGSLQASRLPDIQPINRQMSAGWL